MAKPEHGLWDFLRARMPVGAHYSRIESLETAPGFPDVHLTYKSNSWGWELKCVEWPTGDFPFANDKGLRKSQQIWIADEIAAGGKVLIVAQARTKIYFIHGMYWKILDQLRESTLKNYALLVWDRVGACPVTPLIPILTGAEA